jgi:hypothetical protein
MCINLWKTIFSSVRVVLRSISINVQESCYCKQLNYASPSSFVSSFSSFACYSSVSSSSSSSNLYCCEEKSLLCLPFPVAKSWNPGSASSYICYPYVTVMQSFYWYLFPLFGIEYFIKVSNGKNLFSFTAESRYKFVPVVICLRNLLKFKKGTDTQWNSFVEILNAGIASKILL